MKKFVLIALLFFFFVPRAQNPSQNKGIKKSTGSSGTTQSKTIGAQQTQNLVSTLDGDTCLNRKFSIVFYVILDSSYLPGQATNSAIAEFMDTLNSKFKRICVTFENCSTVYIPNHSYSEWNRITTDSIVTSQWYTEKTMNIYLVDSIFQNFPYEAQGYSYGPPASQTVTTTKDVIVLEKWQLLVNGCVVSMHHIGHFFGLLHTHDEINPTLATVPPNPSNVASKEFVDRSNCMIHGDGLCDTEADPLGGAVKDGKGAFYLPPVDNYMSFSSHACRFTQQQYNRMARVMITSRRYLH